MSVKGRCLCPFRPAKGARAQRAGYARGRGRRRRQADDARPAFASLAIPLIPPQRGAGQSSWAKGDSPRQHLVADARRGRFETCPYQPNQQHQSPLPDNLTLPREGEIKRGSRGRGKGVKGRGLCPFRSAKGARAQRAGYARGRGRRRRQADDAPNSSFCHVAAAVTLRGTFPSERGNPDRLRMAGEVMQRPLDLRGDTPPYSSH